MISRRVLLQGTAAFACSQANAQSFVTTNTSALSLPTGLAVYGANSPTAVEAFETWLGRPVSLVLAYFNQTSNSAFISSVPFIVGAQGGRQCIWSVPMCGADSSIAATNSGTLDSTFTACAVGILANSPANTLIMIRIGWEMNLSSQPWYALGKEAAYISAYKRIHDLFTAQSSRFRFDWCPNVTSTTGTMDSSTVYPGDAYVDVISLDIYYTQGISTSSNQGLDAIAQQTAAVNAGINWQIGFAAVHGKPIGYVEFGNSGTQSQRWNINERGTGLFDIINANNVQYCGQFENTPYEISDGSNPKIAAAFLQMFGPPILTIAPLYNKLVNVGATINLTCYPKVTYQVTSGNATLVGSVLTIPGQGAGTVNVTVVATSAFGAQSTTIIPVQFVAAYTFTNTEASAYVTRMSVQPDEGMKQWIDNLIGGLKSAGSYSLLGAIYIRAIHDAGAALLNVKSTSFPSTVVGAAPFTAFRGYTGGISSAIAYVDVGLKANQAGASQNSWTSMVFHGNDLQSGSPALGANGSSIFANPRASADQFQDWINDFTNIVASNTNGVGVFTAVRSGASARQIYINSMQVATDTTASVQAPGNVEMLEDTTNTSFPDNHIVGFYAVGQALTSTQVANTVTAIQTYLEAIGCPYLPCSGC